MRIPGVLTVLAGLILLGGCSSTYIPPSGRADLGAMSSATMQESFAAEPAAEFPAAIAVVHVQSSGYRSYRTDRVGGVHGHGRYSVVMTREVEEEAEFERIASLPEIGGLVTVSALLLPERLESDRELREAAARLKADMVLLYTFDTSFHADDASVALSVVTLGLSPTRTVSVHVAAAALLLDTRTGFIYAAIEANEKRQSLTNAWESSETADRARRDAEQAAFKALVAEFEAAWPAILERATQGA